MTERHPIEGTPFTIIKDKENWFMVMGDYRVTETTKTKEEQLEKLESEKWLLIMHIAIIAVKKIKMQILEDEMEQYITEKELEKQNIPNYETESL